MESFGVTVLSYRQTFPIFSRMAYFRAANFSDFMREKEKDRENRISTFRTDRVLRSAVRAFGAVTFTSTPHFQCYILPHYFCARYRRGYRQIERGGSCYSGQKKSREEEKGGEGKTESERETQTILSWLRRSVLWESDRVLPLESISGTARCFANERNAVRGADVIQNM